MREKFHYKTETQDSSAYTFRRETTRMRSLHQIICDRIPSAKPSTRSRMCVSMSLTPIKITLIYISGFHFKRQQQQQQHHHSKDW